MQQLEVLLPERGNHGDFFIDLYMPAAKKMRKLVTFKFIENEIC